MAIGGKPIGQVSAHWGLDEVPQTVSLRNAIFRSFGRGSLLMPNASFTVAISLCIAWKGPGFRGCSNPQAAATLYTSTEFEWTVTRLGVSLWNAVISESTDENSI